MRKHHTQKFELIEEDNGNIIRKEMDGGEEGTEPIILKGIEEAIKQLKIKKQVEVGILTWRL